MDSASQNGGAKPKLKLKSASKSNKSSKPKLQISKKNKVKGEMIAKEIGQAVGQEILPEEKVKVKVKVVPQKSVDNSVNKSEKDSKITKKKQSKSKKKSDKKEIINLKEPDANSREFDYQQIILNYDVNNNKSINVLTQYEISIIIGKRASQIAMGALPMIKTTSNMNHIDIAEEELRQKKTPYIIKRDIGSRSEYWKIEDLELSDAI